MKEIIACIKDEDIKFLHSGQISKFVFPMERKDAHEKKISHLIIRVFVFSIDPKGEVRYLIQKRSQSKTSFPDYFTDSASGHVLFKSNMKLRDIEENARRELEEEFGISRKDILKLKFYQLNIEKNNGITEIAYIFLGLVGPETKLRINRDELNIEGSRFYKSEELALILEEKQNVDYSKAIWSKFLMLDAKEVYSLFERTNKSSRNGITLFIGRFQPLHHGHIYVIKYLLSNFEKIKIAIGSSQLSNQFNNPFSGSERKQFIEAALEIRNVPKKRYEIFEIPDIFDSTKWVDHVISIVGNFDIVFSNSDWVRQLFQNRGFGTGKKIEIFKKKFNGTKIRELISKNNKDWKPLVPKEVRDLMEQFDAIKRMRSLVE